MLLKPYFGGKDITLKYFFGGCIQILLAYDATNWRAYAQAQS